MTDLQNLTKEVAQYLGKPWVYGGKGTYTWQAKIVRNDNAEIGTKATGPADNRRIVVTGTYPGNHLPFSTERPRITAAVGRGAEMIAKDIVRRFLPKYLALFEQNMKAKAESEEFHRNEEKARISLCEAVRGKIAFDNSIRFNGPNKNCYGKIEVHSWGDHATIELKNIDFMAAHRLAKFLMADRTKAAP